jgi:hypothetical protein
MKITCQIATFTVALILVASCSDDSSTSSVLPPGSVLYSLESLNVILSAPNSYSFQQVIFGQTVSANRVKVEYLLQTNADSINSIARFQDSTNASPERSREQFLYSPVDSSLSYMLDIPAQPFYLSFRAKLNTYQSGGTVYFIRLKNIKATKVQ